MERLPRTIRIGLDGERAVLDARDLDTWDVDLAACARVGGAAAAIALLAASERDGVDGALAIGISDAVRRGVPTAARASLAARSPLHGGLAEGAAGGALARALVRAADGWIVTGRARAGSVLRIGIDGARVMSCSVERAEVGGLGVRERAGRFAPHAGAALVAGPAAALAFAHVAVASRVDGRLAVTRTGRAGLGCVLHGLGLVAIVVESTADETEESASHVELVRALTASPRLRARSADGSLELFEAAAARGEMPRDRARALVRGARADAVGRGGCRGCPTPCGVVLANGDGSHAAHHTALAPFAELLPDAALDRLTLCVEAADDMGLDAIEVARVLEIADAAGVERLPSGGEQRARAVVARIRALADGADALGGGAARLAARTGHDAPAIERGHAVRAAHSLAARAANRLVPGGGDLVRIFPALLEGAEAEALRRQAPWIGPGDVRPDDPARLGALLAWCETLAAACDASGFCAFSAAGLVADGTMGLDALAAHVVPGARGADWIAAGERLAFARAAFDARHGARAEGAPARGAAALPDDPALARVERDYRAWRGLGDDHAPTAQAWHAWERGDVLPREIRGGDAPARATEEIATGAVRVHVRGSGGLGVLDASLEVPAPATVGALLARLAHERPGLAARLFDAGGMPRPSAWRRGRRLFTADALADGDEVELVLALSGG